VRLTGLDPRFKILASRPAANAEQLASLSRRFPAVADEFVELSSDATELELEFEGKYLRIWHPNTCAEMDEGYGISTRLHGAIPIGDDGGGRVLLYFTGTGGRGLYRVGYGDLDPEDAAWVAASLDKLLSTGDGMGNI